MIKVTYMPATNRDDHLGKEFGNEAEVSLEDFYKIVEGFVCRECYEHHIDYHSNPDETRKAETIGDLMSSPCACELWVEDDMNLVDYDRRIGGYPDGFEIS